MPDSWQVTQHTASNWAVIYRVPLEVFPAYYAHAFVLLAGEHKILVDTGSGLPSSNRDLLAGFTAIGDQFGTSIRVDDLTLIVITHGHIDHVGGTDWIRKLASDAQIAIHELDCTSLTNPHERTRIAHQRMGNFLRQAGVPENKRQQLLALYVIGKPDLTPIAVDVILRDGDTLADCMEVIHVPGHAPGLIMLRVGDTLLTSDHILPKTSVALSPESIFPYTGVGHYLDSLLKASHLEGIQVALGGHEEMIPDYADAVIRTTELSSLKIKRILDRCAEPRTVYQLASDAYGVMDGYTELLMVEQVGARVEYLSQRGQLAIENLDEVLADNDQPRLYRQSR